MVNKVSDESDEDTSINYWNMKDFMPFFGCDDIEFDKLRQKIGSKAATKIQSWWRGLAGILLLS